MQIFLLSGASQLVAPVFCYCFVTVKQNLRNSFLSMIRSVQLAGGNIASISWQLVQCTCVGSLPLLQHHQVQHPHLPSQVSV